MFWTCLLGSFAVLSCGITLWQWWVAARFPLHRRLTNASFAPPVTLLKPLNGVEPDTVECLRSWLRQDYSAPVQILFGVDSADDPACAIVRQVIAEHPHLDAQLVVCGAALGLNERGDGSACSGPAVPNIKGGRRPSHEQNICRRHSFENGIS